MIPESTSRLDKVQKQLIRWGVEGLLIDDPIDLFYLTGKELSAGLIVILPTQATLFVDGRYFENCKREVPFSVQLSRGSFFEELSILLQGVSLKLGFDSTALSYQKVFDLTNSLKEGVQLIPLKQPLREIRQIKDLSEQRLLKQASHLCSLGFNHLFNYIKEGVEEKELSLCLKKFWLDQGGERVSFEPIIAFGENGSMPHYRAGSARLKKDQSILVDIGVEVDHYQSDMTRMIFFGTPTEEFQKIYNIVYEAQKRGLDALKPRRLVKEIDFIARDWISQKGYGSKFTHSLGHGVGLEIHELPVLRSNGPQGDIRLEAGMVVTVEPGIYLPGWGGVRIEDTVLITENGHEILTTSPKELYIHPK
jgi:Xaa-Pro aminopeptidase